MPVQAVLIDNGREFSGRPEQHPYQLPLALHDIEHRTTKVRSPRTNGFVEITYSIFRKFEEAVAPV